jgi:hypothetical protein
MSHSASTAKITFTFHTDKPILVSFKQLTSAIPQIPVDVGLSGQTMLITGDRFLIRKT